LRRDSMASVKDLDPIIFGAASLDQ
jgi:hypothetical protein